MKKLTLTSPNYILALGRGYEGHEFFEASSIRKKGDLYYFVYSSVESFELCYATSQSLVGGFTYRGVIISNNDIHINTYKPAEKPMFYGGNNHGSIVEIAGEWYVFYHRHTNGTSYSRQGCFEKVHFEEDGSIPQVEITSCAGVQPLEGKGEYPAYLACHLYCNEEATSTAYPGCMDSKFPKIMQDGADGDKKLGYIANMWDGATAGFKYFDFKGVRAVSVTTRGFSTGGYFEVKNAWNGQVLGTIPIGYSHLWKKHTAQIHLPDGIFPLYFTYRGDGNPGFGSFTLEV